MPPQDRLDGCRCDTCGKIASDYKHPEPEEWLEFARHNPRYAIELDVRKGDMYYLYYNEDILDFLLKRWTKRDPTKLYRERISKSDILEKFQSSEVDAVLLRDTPFPSVGITERAAVVGDLEV